MKVLFASQAAAGVALSAGDAYFLDRIAKGWKPNQSVNDSLANFAK